MKEHPMGAATTSNVSPWFDEKHPMHLALAWRRLGVAFDAVHNATGNLHHPVCESIEAIRTEVWSDLFDRTTTDEREEALAWAAEFMGRSSR